MKEYKLLESFLQEGPINPGISKIAALPLSALKEKYRSFTIKALKLGNREKYAREVGSNWSKNSHGGVYNKSSNNIDDLQRGIRYKLDEISSYINKKLGEEEGRKVTRNIRNKINKSGNFNKFKNGFTTWGFKKGIK